MSYFPMILGLAVACGLIVYVEVTLRRERLSGLRARQSIIDRRLLRVQSAIDRIERRLDAMTLDRELVAQPCHIVVNAGGDEAKASIAKQISAEFAKAISCIDDSSPSPCLDCGVVNAHTEECALSMDGLVESPTDAAARRGRD